MVACEVGGCHKEIGGSGDLCWEGEFGGKQEMRIVLGGEIWGVCLEW